MSSSNILVLSDLTADFSQFKTQFEDYLATTPTWVGTLTTMTSTTLVDLASSLGAFAQGRIIRVYEDSFSESAQSDDSIYAITQMQGLRMSRKSPASLGATLTATIGVTLNPLTQFLISGQYYFNRDQVTLVANTPLSVTLYQGQVAMFSMNGLGTSNQTFLSDSDSFTVSDQDAQVQVNGVIIPKSLGGLWNYKNLPAYADLTTADGRLLLVFGSNQFGITPQITDTVLVTYPVTQGIDGNNQTLVNAAITVAGFPYLTGIVTSNPQGGSDQQPVQTYKNLASGAFGTYTSAVTKSQYEATVGVYPGIVDAFTQAQRDINPLALEWMNVIRVSAITTSVWSQAQTQTFLNYLQTVTMYSGRFVWQDPIAVPNNVTVTVYCFNTAVLATVQAACQAALIQLFAARPGILMTNFYESDITDACKTAGNGAVSYVIVQTPTTPMIVTAPPSPIATYTLVAGGGTLGPLLYAYGITSVNGSSVEGPPSNWVFPQVTSTAGDYAITINWNALPGSASYKVYGRAAGGIGLLATISAGSGGPYSFTDNGSITPTGLPPNSIAQVPISYNSLGTLVVNMAFSERQQQLDPSPSSPSRGII